MHTGLTYYWLTLINLTTLRDVKPFSSLCSQTAQDYQPKGETFHGSSLIPAGPRETTKLSLFSTACNVYSCCILPVAVKLLCICGCMIPTEVSVKVRWNCLPTMLFWGGGGMMQPSRLCLTASFSYKPRKSLNLRRAENVLLWNAGSVV